MSLEAKTANLNGKIEGSTALPKSVFGQTISEPSVFETLIWQRAKRRQGTAKTKTRKEVSGGGKKPFKQKGTGNARQGSNRSPLMPGGGRVFGPHPRDYEFALPKKIRNKAILSVLSQKAIEGKVFVLDETKMQKPSTKIVSEFIKNNKLKNALFVDGANENLRLSVRNVAKAYFSDVRSINVYDLLKFENLVVSKASLKTLEERYGHAD